MDVREAAAKALGKLGDKRAIEPLIKALGDEISLVREAAKKSLKILARGESSIVQSHTHFLCSKCFLRPKIEKVKIGFLRRLKFVACRKCGFSTQFVKINTVIGQIGGDLGEEPKQDRDILYLQMYFPEKKDMEKIRDADIDVLEVYPHHNGRPFDKLELAEVCERFLSVVRKDQHRGIKYLKTKTLILINNPPFDTNTMRNLERAFGKVEVKKW